MQVITEQAQQTGREVAEVEEQIKEKEVPVTYANFYRKEGNLAPMKSLKDPNIGRQKCIRRLGTLRRLEPGGK